MSDDRITTQTALAAVDELTQVLGWLAANLLPGTTKPYRAPVMSAEKLAARAAEDRAYKQMAVISGTIPLGESPAPLDLNVMDLLSEILVAADDMAEKVATHAGQPILAAASSAFADPGPYLALIRENLTRASFTEPSILGYVEDRCDSLISAGHQQLGLLNDGQTLKAVCPWCGGRGEADRLGEHTLKVRAILPVGEKFITHVDPAEVRWFVVCHGLNCDPPSKDCGNWVRGRPAWDLRNEDRFLAKRLEKAS